MTQRVLDYPGWCTVHRGLGGHKKKRCMGKGWGYNTWRARKVKENFLSINEENIYFIILLRARSVYHIA